MRRIIYSVSAMICLTLVLGSCKKDDSGSGLKAVFSYVADGYKVSFTNFSANATSYSWDFGDGSGDTSSKKAPQHIFTAKGDFLVTLTASNGTETNIFKDTVSVIGPNIKIDNDLSDWEYVSYAYENAEDYTSTLRAVKTFGGPSDVFFYLEGTSDMKLELFDMYVDSDNDPATGFSTWMYPAGSGADNLLEGPAGSPSWGSVYVHAGTPADFSFNPILTFDEAMSFGPMKTVAGKNVMEFSIKKSALKNATNKAINFAFIELNPGWTQLGTIPEAATPASAFIKVPL